jgi:hypothetical protein
MWSELFQRYHSANSLGNIIVIIITGSFLGHEQSEDSSRCSLFFSFRVSQKSQVDPENVQCFALRLAV